ncbi:hypothetical protein [Sorangium sp. So ce145]
MIQAAAVDGEIVPEERAYLKAVADVLGISQEEIEQRLAKQLAAAP